MLTTGKERILIIVPHADDEVLGCGGLIEKACRYNNDVKVVLATVGDTFFLHSSKTISSQTRQKEFIDAINFLGCTDYDILYEDQEAKMDTIPQKEIVSKLDNLLDSYKPTCVFIPYPSFHQDHQALFDACMASLRPKPNVYYKLIAMYEYPQIVWQYPKIHDTGEIYLDISHTVDKKVEAFKKHVSQIRDEEHLISPKNIKLWAEKRGMEIGVAYAEKYYLMKGNFL